MKPQGHRERRGWKKKGPLITASRKVPIMLRGGPRERIKGSAKVTSGVGRVLEGRTIYPE